jgi:hypothetical protein
MMGFGRFGGVEMRAAQLRREPMSLGRDLGRSPGVTGERGPLEGDHGAVLCHRAGRTRGGVA